MSSSTWECGYCGTEGSDLPPDSCPECTVHDIYPTEAGVRLQLKGWTAIQNQIAAIAAKLGCTPDQVDISQDTITISWAQKCPRGCCEEKKSSAFPLKHLWETQ